jgi:hypothetical protein
MQSTFGDHRYNACSSKIKGLFGFSVVTAGIERVTQLQSLNFFTYNSSTFLQSSFIPNKS